MLSLEQVQDFCNMHDYDIRKSKNGRWIDQKCTPDVVWSIADFVLYYVDNVKDTFSAKDIWRSDYANETIAETYSKPGVTETAAQNEYDKVFSQPLCMLCAAGILKDISHRADRHLYIVESREVLEYIARNDLCSLRFLQIYIENTLKDSGLWPFFEEFFFKQDKTSFSKLKNAFIDFYHNFTPIQKEYEPKRIFTKVLNPLAAKYNKLGTSSGKLSTNIITRAELMYNRDNFRDVYRDKPRNITRKEWLEKNPDIDIRNGYFEQMMSRTKRELKDFMERSRNNLSELSQFSKAHSGEEINVPATQIHHIFPKNEFPEIMHYLENMIALTPNQHFSFAHPKNNTQIIDFDSQKELLIAKACSIEYNLKNEEDKIYDFSRFLNVLRVGWDDESVLEIPDNSFVEVMHEISLHYA